MPIVRTHAKGQIIMPKEIRDKLGIKPGKALSVKIVHDHVEIKTLPDDPIEYLTGIFADHRTSMAAELLKERKKDNEKDEADSV
jgi:AbrB family looped-hinge helix DNA binding protein